MKLRARTAIALAVALAGLAAAGDGPGDSLYVLRPAMVDQAGAAVGLDVFRDRPALVSMFYASCPNVCPLLVGALQRLERELPEASRERLRVLLVSLDPEKDTPQALAGAAERHGIDLRRWKLARASAGDVRLIAAALGVQYRKLPDGNFNHSTVITLVDPSGRIVAQTSRLGEPDADFVNRLRAALAVSATRAR